MRAVMGIIEALDKKEKINWLKAWMLKCNKLEKSLKPLKISVKKCWTWQFVLKISISDVSKKSPKVETLNFEVNFVLHNGDDYSRIFWVKTGFY